MRAVHKAREAVADLADLSDAQAEQWLRRNVWWLLLGAALLGMLAVRELHEVSAARDAATREAREWRTQLEHAFAIRHATLKQLEPMRSKDAVAAIREGPNGTVAWVARLGDRLSAAQVSFSDLKDRVTRGLAMVKQGWWEAEQHFRLYHTHDRGSSPLVRMCLPISITTANTQWRRLGDMLLMRNLLPSLLNTMEDGYHYGVYIGYDAGDPLLDRPGAEAELHKLWDAACAQHNKHVELRLFRYNDTRHFNVWAVNYITKEAYLDGYDYFFRINDDSEFRGGGWTSRLVEALQLNEDFGAAGVLDQKNPRIWTHSIVGRPHVEIFGFHFPFTFGNWWSDDWITFAYSRRFSLWLYDVDIHHHQHAPRYNIDWTDNERRLQVELERSQVRWKQWLCKTRDLAEFCGPADARREAQLSEVPLMKTARVPSLSAERLLAMEDAARTEQYARMARFPKKAKKS